MMAPLLLNFYGDDTVKIDPNSFKPYISYRMRKYDNSVHIDPARFNSSLPVKMTPAIKANVLDKAFQDQKAEFIRQLKIIRPDIYRSLVNAGPLTREQQIFMGNWFTQAGRWFDEKVTQKVFKPVGQLGRFIDKSLISPTGELTASTIGAASNIVGGTGRGVGSLVEGIGTGGGSLAMSVGAGGMDLLNNAVKGVTDIFKPAGINVTGGGAGPLGIPLMYWVVGGGALVLLLAMSKKKSGGGAFPGYAPYAPQPYYPQPAYHNPRRP